MRKSLGIALALMIGATGLSGCLSTHTQRSTATGGVIGAGIGALATHSLAGAVIGGAVGAGAGYVVARNSHPCWRRNIITGYRYRGYCLN